MASLIFLVEKKHVAMNIVKDMLQSWKLKEYSIGRGEIKEMMRKHSTFANTHFNLQHFRVAFKINNRKLSSINLTTIE